MHVVATAGHVDHGKSTLVEALTGIDPDRFAEEKARGLTIDLGFAWTTLPTAGEIGFVDVPGHVRFIKNMLAGVGAVDACLFVVAATEGWKPQSEEHLRILELLGLQHGVVALTKVATLDDTEKELAVLEIAERVAGTFLEDASVVPVDAPGGVGLDDLRVALDDMVGTTPDAVDRGRPRLWIDRSFAAKGSGTIVTGTLTGGALHLDDDVVLIPSGRTARVRGLQTHRQSLDRAGPGRRLAVNLAGVAHHDVQRGHAVVRPGQWFRTRKFDASLRVLASLDHDVGRRGAYQAYIGSGEHAVAVRVLGREGIAPGTEGAVRLHLPDALPLTPGDRFVLRESGRGETVGGGEVLDVDPVLPASRARPDRSIDRVVTERGWVDAAQLELLVGEKVPATVGHWVMSPSARRDIEDRLGEAVDTAGATGVDLATLNDQERALVATMDDVVVVDGRLRRRGADDPLLSHPYLAALDAAPFAPPTPAEHDVDPVTLRALVQRGLVVERDGVYFAAAAVHRAAETVARLLAARPDGVTVSEVREALGSTRKYVMPLLSRLDAEGVTRRRGDVRIAGPRLPKL